MAARDVRTFLPFVGQVVASLVVFALLEQVILGLTRLPAAAYEQAFLGPEILSRAVGLLRTRVPAVALVGGVALVALAFLADGKFAGSAGRRRAWRILGGWSDAEDGTALRWLIVAACGIAALSLAAYPYNAYFDQAHLMDRVLLGALWGGIIWRPLFALPFAVVASAMGGQFQIPLRSYSWTEMELLVRIPILFGAFWIVRSLFGERRVDLFVFLLSCLIAATWWASGWGKVRVGWITHPHIDLLLLGAHANGWLGFLDGAAAVRIAHAVAAVRIPLMIFTLVVECGALFILWRRWSLPAFLVLTSMLHVGAFALTGIFFWKWILIDLAFLTFLLYGRRVQRLRIFSLGHFVLAVILILGSQAWVAARNLTWFDTPLTYSIRLEGVDTKGNVHVLPAGFFRPYAETFVLETFPYLTPYPQLTGPMGVTQSRRIANALLAAEEPQEIFGLERTLGASRYDSERSARFDQFVARWIKTVNRKGVYALPAPPRHLWTFPLDAVWEGAPPIVRVNVDEITSFYSGTALREIRRRRLRTIDIDWGADMPAVIAHLTP